MELLKNDSKLPDSNSSTNQILTLAQSRASPLQQPAGTWEEQQNVHTEDPQLKLVLRHTAVHVHTRERSAVWSPSQSGQTVSVFISLPIKHIQLFMAH